MQSLEEHAAFRADRKAQAVNQVLNNLRGDLDIARGRLKRAQKAHDLGDRVLGGNVAGLAAEIVRLEAAIVEHVRHHNLAA